MLSIDRFEDIYAICESDDQKLFAIEISELPSGAKPGDIICISSDGNLSIDKEETAKRKERIKKLQDKLFK